MPGTIGLVKGLLVHSSGLTIAGLLVGNDGLTITAASLTSITYTVNRFNADGTRTQTGSGTLTIGSVVFNPPVTTDPRYTLAGGYSFLATIPAAAFTTEGLFHRVDVTFVPNTGEQWVQEWGGVTI